MFGKEIAVRLLTFSFFFPFFWVFPRVESWKLRGRYHAFLQLLNYFFLLLSCIMKIFSCFSTVLLGTLFIFLVALIIFHNVGNHFPTCLPKFWNPKK